MDYQVVSKPGFTIVGKSRRFTETNDRNKTEIPHFWNELLSDRNGNNVLMDLTQNRPGSITGSMSLGLSMCEVGAEEFTYVIGAETTAKTIPVGFEAFHVPAARWAVFECIGPVPDAIQDNTKRIFSEWFPLSGYEHPKHELEVYLPGDTHRKDYRCQVWIHVNAK